MHTGLLHDFVHHGDLGRSDPSAVRKIEQSFDSVRQLDLEIWPGYKMVKGRAGLSIEIYGVTWKVERIRSRTISGREGGNRNGEEW